MKDAILLIDVGRSFHSAAPLNFIHFFPNIELIPYNVDFVAVYRYVREKKLKTQFTVSVCLPAPLRTLSIRPYINLLIYSFLHGGNDERSTNATKSAAGFNTASAHVNL